MSNYYQLPPYQKRFESKANDQNIMSYNATQLELPTGTVPLSHQVAGHTFQIGTEDIGILKDQNDGCVLKPATKLLCGIREIKFYEKIQTTNDPYLAMVREHAPQFKGTVKLKIGGKMVEFIKLSDITHDMTEPCIIDIKIGKRTWDPLATQEKIDAEEKKYRNCKNNLGFCIPGFQVYDITTNRIRRFGKEYGKKLNENTIEDAFKIFLNAEAGLSRTLLMQILSQLWSIQKWARNQKSLRLYSSSLLIAYDARRLRNTLQINKKNSNSLSNLNGKLSPTLLNGVTTTVTERNGKTSPSPLDSVQVFKKLQRCHSAQNNYDEDMKNIQQNYTIMLDNLVGSQKDSEVWAHVKMIDFAHVFPGIAENGGIENSLDKNYLFGIEHLVRMFEEFLKQCE